MKTSASSTFDQMCEQLKHGRQLNLQSLLTQALQICRYRLGHQHHDQMMEHKLNPTTSLKDQTKYYSLFKNSYCRMLAYTSALRVCRHFRKSDGLNVHGAKI